jgi:hypothetical protein
MSETTIRDGAEAVTVEILKTRRAERTVWRDVGAG